MKKKDKIAVGKYGLRFFFERHMVQLDIPTNKNGEAVLTKEKSLQLARLLLNSALREY